MPKMGEFGNIKFLVTKMREFEQLSLIIKGGMINAITPTGTVFLGETSELDRVLDETTANGWKLSSMMKTDLMDTIVFVREVKPID